MRGGFIMKRIIFLFMVMVMLLSACSGPEQHQHPSTAPITAPTTESTAGPTTESTTEPTTEPVETTEPTEAPPEVIGLQVEDWYVEPEYLSYEEYFAEDRPYYADNCNWLKTDGDSNRVFQATMDTVGILINELYTDQQGYLVPGSEKYSDAQLLAADGMNAYLYQDNQVIRVDMESGDAYTIFDGPIIMTGGWFENIHMCGELVLYYATYEDGVLNIGHIYLPEAKTVNLYSRETDCYEFYLYAVNSTQGEVKWTILRQEFVDAVKKEWKDPDSKYKSGKDYDLSEEWGTEEGLNNIFTSRMYQYELQEAMGIRALEEATLHADGTVTTRIGALDYCYFGSDMMHDHYAPDVDTVPEIKPSAGEWTAVEVSFELSGERDTDTGSYFVLADELGDAYLYYQEDGEIVYKLDEPIRDVTFTGQCLVCLLPDGCLYALDLDNYQLSKLYEAEYGGIRDVSLSYADRESLCILDGNAIVEFDLVNCRYRTLLQHDYIVSAHFADEDEREYLYFFVRNGMYAGQFLLYMDNFELEEVYWL